MTFDDFLAALAQALAEPIAGPWPGPPSALPTREPVLRVIHDPGRREATAPDQLLIGVGHWLFGDHPVEHRGVCLNNKGTAYRFGAAYQYASVTDFVLAPPEPLLQHWERVTDGYRELGQLLRHFTLVVEDVGPDSCFSLLCWLARGCHVDVGELRNGKGKPWVQAVHAWETTGMAEAAFSSWAALLSALGHSYLPAAEVQQERDTQTLLDLSRPWHEALQFTVALLQQNVDPTAVPPAWHLSGYTRAKAFLNGEYQDYRESLAQAVRLQLWVPMCDTGDSRELLVDAYFAVETWPSGSKKLFIRTDRKNTWLRQGFALMGIYRPGERGTGNDMTVSVNPWTGIYLKALWEELERLENERWEGQRPRDNIRTITGYAGAEGYNEPWWDDYGRYTLLGAPKALRAWPAGSRLEWPAVIEAAWRCYSPVRDLLVRDLLHNQQDCLLEQCQRDRLHCQDGPLTLTKHLVAVRWLPDMAKPQALFLAPTAKRVYAALVARERAQGPLTIADLPEEQDFAFVPLTGGFAVLHERGVFLFDDWHSEDLKIDEIREEFRCCCLLLGTLRAVGGQLNDRAQEQPTKATSPPLRQSLAILTELATLRAQLAWAKSQYGPHSSSADVRRFRAQLEDWWGIDKGVDALQRRISDLEDASRTTSQLRTQGLVKIISIYGVPFVISHGLTTSLAPWIDKLLAPGVASLMKVVIYLGLAAVLIILALGLQRVWLRPGQKPTEISPARQTPDPGQPDN